MSAQLAVTIVAVIIALCQVACSREARLQRDGDQLVAQIETFRDAHGRLPTSIAELGLPEAEEGPLYYERTSDERYVVWFGTSLGESMTYDSLRRSWKAGN